MKPLGQLDDRGAGARSDQDLRFDSLGAPASETSRDALQVLSGGLRKRLGGLGVRGRRHHDTDVRVVDDRHQDRQHDIDEQVVGVRRHPHRPDASRECSRRCPSRRARRRCARMRSSMPRDPRGLPVSSRRTSSTGSVDSRAIVSATLPNQARLIPVRPCVDITRRSAPCSRAYFSIASAGTPSSTATWHVQPNCSVMRAATLRRWRSICARSKVRIRSSLTAPPSNAGSRGSHA